jgi:hypothetical protein
MTEQPDEQGGVEILIRTDRDTPRSLTFSGPDIGGIFVPKSV